MQKRLLFLVLAALVVVLAGCNLGASAPTPTNTVQPTRTPSPTFTATRTISVPTNLPPPGAATLVRTSPGGVIVPPTLFFPPTSVQPTRIIPAGTIIPPISVANLPAQGATNISISSPGSGSQITQNAVSVTGAAQHPNFLQYVLEYGPDPNPSNLWYPITGAVGNQVSNGTLGTWSTASIPNGTYSLRLKVFLRDGTMLTTVTPNIRISRPPTAAPPTATLSSPRPYAAFAPESYTVVVQQPLRFFNQSGGNITSFQWSFGDGNFSNLQNPTHTYAQPGSYTVTLTVNGPGGSTAVSSIVTAYQINAPTAAFIADRIVGYAPLTVTFTNQSSSNATSFLWNFGDGTTATTRDAVKVFTAPGNYTVTLTASGSGGSTIVQRIITVLGVPTPTPTGTPAIQPPIANFITSQNVGFPPLLVEFNNLSVGTISTINWNFGDGQLSTERNPVHLYTQPGNYTVTLIVTGPGGQSFRQSLVIVRALPTNTPTSTPIPPTSTPTNTLVPPTVTLTPSPTNTSSPTNTPEVIVVTATFTLTNTPEPPTATFTASPTETAVPPTATPTETLIPSETPTGTVPPTETPLPPTATPTETATETPTETAPPLPTETPTTIPLPTAAFTTQPIVDNSLALQFVNQSSADAFAFEWNFGDNVGTSSDPNPVYQYAVGGTYVVTLTVTGPGGSSAVQQPVTVTDPTPVPPTVTAAVPPTAAFSFEPVVSNTLAVQFFSQSTPDILSHEWNFGDGSPLVTEVNPVHQFASGGTYLVTLTVTNAAGINAVQQQVTVLDPTPLPPTETTAPTETPVPTETPIPAPSAGFAIQVVDGNSLALQFVNQSSPDVTAFEWNFGDGNTSTEADPVHQYVAGGEYLVTLIVTGPGGQDLEQQSAIVVEPTPIPPTETPIPPPTAAFAVQNVDGNSLALQFVNQSSPDVTALEWNFGDGNTSTDANPVHQYNAAGDYLVTLTVISAGGQTQAQQPVTVLQPTPVPPTETPIPPPTAAFAVQNVDGNSLALQFVNQSSPDVTALEWSFGDGNTSTEANPVYQYNAAGDYLVTLTVTGPGGQAQAQQTVTVIQPTPLPQPPTAAFAVQAVDGNLLAVQFFNQSSPDVFALEWNFGDGNTSTEANPLHQYTNSGEYTVTLLVTGPGGQNSTQQPVVVSAPPTETPIPPPTAAFAVQPVDGNPLALQFLNQSSPDVFALEWNFGDGSPVSNEANPVHQFPVGNTYLVTLTVSGPGGQNSAQQQVQVVDPTPAPATETPIPLPTAQFSVQPVNGNPLALQFINESSPDVFAVEWTFGDNVGFSTDPNPVYQYGAAGTYTVTLTVTGPGGQNFAQQDVTVTAPEVAPTDEPISAATVPSVDPIFTLAGFGGPATGVSWNPTGAPPQVATSSEDDNGLVWDVFSQQVLMPLNGFGANVNAVAWNPGAAIVAAAGDEGFIQLFDPTTGGILATLTSHTDAVNSLAWLSNGSLLVSASDDQSVKVWDATGNLLATLTGHTDAVTSAVFTPDGSRVISGSADGSILAWDWSTGTVVWQIAAHPNGINEIVSAADGARIISVGEDGQIQIWISVGDNAPSATLSVDATPLTAVAISPDGSRFVTGDEVGTMYLWTIGSSTPTQMLVGHLDRITDIAFSPDGSQVAASSDDTTVVIWQP